MNLLRILLASVLIMIPAFCLTGCATAESDVDDVAGTAVKGLEGKGQLYNENVMKGDMGGQFGNDFQ